MTTINTNIGAIAAQANMTKVNNDFNTAMTRLSSGLRINGAKDDAAGMAIAEKMTSQVMGINQAIRNAADGKNLLDTTESAHVEVSNMLQRVRELAVQSANDTNTGSDRGNITAEARQLIAEINRVAENTTFNGMRVMDGSFNGKQFQIGADAGQTLSISIDSTAATKIGAYQVSSTASVDAREADPSATPPVVPGVSAQSLVISGYAGNATINAGAGWSAQRLASEVNNVSAQTGVQATATTKAQLSFSDTSTAGRVTMRINGVSIGSNVAVSGEPGNLDLRSLRDAINAQTTRTGVTAQLGENNSSIVLTDGTGGNISITDYASTQTNDGNAATLRVQALDADGKPVAGATTALTDQANEDNATITGQVSFSSTQSFSINAEDETAGFFDTSDLVTVDNTDPLNPVTTTSERNTTFNASLSSVADIDLSTAESAAKAIGVIDVALQKISQARGNLGAMSNRLDSTISNLTNISVSVQTARSQVTDADFAKESTNLARGQILSQAATAMLAQANSSKQNVLSLLRG